MMVNFIDFSKKANNSLGEVYEYYLPYHRILERADKSITKSLELFERDFDKYKRGQEIIILLGSSSKLLNQMKCSESDLLGIQRDLQQLHSDMGLFYKTLDEGGGLSPYVFGSGNLVKKFSALKLSLEEYRVVVFSETEKSIKDSLISISKTRNRMLTVCTSSIVGIISIIIFLGQVANRRLMLISNGAKRLGAGDFNSKIDMPTDDSFGELARAFNSMSSSLCDKGQELNRTMDDLENTRRSLLSLNEELEARVEDRTFELELSLRMKEAEIVRRKEVEEQLKLSHEVIRNTSEAVVITDDNNLIIDVNDAFTEITGYSRDEALGMNPGFTKSGIHDSHFYEEMWSQIINHGRWQGEVINSRKDGEDAPIWISISVIKDSEGHLSNYIAIFSDISEMKETHKKLSNLAYSDALTKLGNRNHFRNTLKNAIRTAKLNEQQFMLLFIDLDRFKEVNDTLGHESGDKLLIEISTRLKGCIRRATDVVTRFGGDEFSFLMQGCGDIEIAKDAAGRIIAKIGEPVNLGGHTVNVGASIGIVCYPNDGGEFDTVIRRADCAMYKAKEAGRNCYRVFDLKMEQNFHTKEQLAEDIRHALRRREFEILYQPQVDMLEGRVVGVEALLRWKDGDLIVYPEEFMPIAEEVGMVSNIRDYVFDEVCSQIKKWDKSLREELHVSINLTLAEFNEPGLLTSIGKYVKIHDINFSPISFELTESTVMKDVEYSFKTFHGLKKMGLKVSLGDFGGGCSLLQYIRCFPIDVIKIDQIFIELCHSDPEDAKVVKEVISLAHDMKAKVVAAGVECIEQKEFLLSKGCNLCQGYYYSKPLSGSELEGFYENYCHENSLIVEAELPVDLV